MYSLGVVANIEINLRHTRNVGKHVPSRTRCFKYIENRLDVKETKDETGIEIMKMKIKLCN